MLWPFQTAGKKEDRNNNAAKPSDNLPLSSGNTEPSPDAVMMTAVKCPLPADPDDDFASDVEDSAIRCCHGDSDCKDSCSASSSQNAETLTESIASASAEEKCTDGRHCTSTPTPVLTGCDKETSLDISEIPTTQAGDANKLKEPETVSLTGKSETEFNKAWIDSTNIDTLSMPSANVNILQRSISENGAIALSRHNNTIDLENLVRDAMEASGDSVKTGSVRSFRLSSGEDDAESVGSCRSLSSMSEMSEYSASRSRLARQLSGGFTDINMACEAAAL